MAVIFVRCAFTNACVNPGPLRRVPGTLNRYACAPHLVSFAAPVGCGMNAGAVGSHLPRVAAPTTRHGIAVMVTQRK